MITNFLVSKHMMCHVHWHRPRSLMKSFLLFYRKWLLIQLLEQQKMSAFSNWVHVNSENRFAAVPKLNSSSPDPWKFQNTGTRALNPAAYICDSIAMRYVATTGRISSSRSWIAMLVCIKFTVLNLLRFHFVDVHWTQPQQSEIIHVRSNRVALRRALHLHVHVHNLYLYRWANFYFGMMHHKRERKTNKQAKVACYVHTCTCDKSKWCQQTLAYCTF